jgi:hypothetical protein
MRYFAGSSSMTKSENRYECVVLLSIESPTSCCVDVLHTSKFGLCWTPSADVVTLVSTSFFTSLILVLFIYLLGHIVCNSDNFRCIGVYFFSSDSDITSSRDIHRCIGVHSYTWGVILLAIVTSIDV